MNQAYIPQLGESRPAPFIRQMKDERISDRITFTLIGWVIGVLSSAVVVYIARASVEGF